MTSLKFPGPLPGYGPDSERMFTKSTTDNILSSGAAVVASLSSRQHLSFASVLLLLGDASSDSV